MVIGTLIAPALDGFHGFEEGLEALCLLLVAIELVVPDKLLLVLVGEDGEIAALPHQVVHTRTAPSRHLSHRLLLLTKNYLLLHARLFAHLPVSRGRTYPCLAPHLLKRKLRHILLCRNDLSVTVRIWSFILILILEFQCIGGIYQLSEGIELSFLFGFFLDCCLALFFVFFGVGLIDPFSQLLKSVGLPDVVPFTAVGLVEERTKCIRDALAHLFFSCHKAHFTSLDLRVDPQPKGFIVADLTHEYQGRSHQEISVSHSQFLYGTHQLNASAIMSKGSNDGASRTEVLEVNFQREAERSVTEHIAFRREDSVVYHFGEEEAAEGHALLQLLNVALAVCLRAEDDGEGGRSWMEVELQLLLVSPLAATHLLSYEILFTY